jgi:hypothetical protein
MKVALNKENDTFTVLAQAEPKLSASFYLLTCDLFNSAIRSSDSIVEWLDG